MLLLSVGVHDVQSNSGNQNDTLQNVLNKGINTDHGKAVEQGDQEDTAKHGADNVTLTTSQGDTTDDGADNCVELIVLTVGNSDGVQTSHQNQATEGSGDRSQDEGAELVELNIDTGEECCFCRAADSEDVTTNLGVGQQQLFASRYFRFNRSRSIITSGGLGTMGFGLPAAIGAKIGAPERDVCLFVGDGGLQMTSQELGTIYQSQVGVKIVLMNNGFLGMVRQWQELFYDRRYSFTELTNPDFELLAKANRIPYRCVERHEDLADAVKEMHDTDGAFLLEVRVEKEENVFPMVPAGQPVHNIRLE